jgi:hypothetical protein
VLELTTKGVPSAAVMWYHVSWSSGAFDSHQSMKVVQSGWPIPCLQSETLITNRQDWIGTEVETGGGVPLRPLALGMVANTLMYSVPLALLALAPGAIRSLLFSRKGKCPKCGYAVLDLPVCPECGAAGRGAATQEGDAAKRSTPVEAPVEVSPP